MNSAANHFTFCQTAADYEIGKELFIEYAQSLGFDLGFQGFDEELEQIQKKYGTPEGALILAWHEQKAVGCVGIRKLDDGTAELKRLYVKPDYRKFKLGEELMILSIQEAKKLGYPALKLDTLASFTPAVNLYKKLGFQEIEPYNYNPFDNVVYMELKL